MTNKEGGNRKNLMKSLIYYIYKTTSNAFDGFWYAVINYLIAKTSFYNLGMCTETVSLKYEYAYDA
jgi:hypothetical protein